MISSSPGYVMDLRTLETLFHFHVPPTSSNVEVAVVSHGETCPCFMALELGDDRKDGPGWPHLSTKSHTQ